MGIDFVHLNVMSSYAEQFKKVRPFLNQKAVKIALKDEYSMSSVHRYLVGSTDKVPYEFLEALERIGIIKAPLVFKRI